MYFFSVKKSFSCKKQATVVSDIKAIRHCGEFLLGDEEKKDIRRANYKSETTSNPHPNQPFTLHHKIY
jgi:hypothetical protein